MASTVTELLRRRFEGKSKPYDAEVEWLSSDGSAYIDTEIVPKDSPRVVINLTSLDVSTDVDVFGFSSNTIPSFIGNFSVNNITQKQNFVYFRYYSTLGIGQSLVSSVEYNDWAEWDLGYIIKCNNETLNTLERQSFASNSQTLYLFKGRSIANIRVRVGKVKIYDGDELKRDFIPVRVGTVGYMYDKVSKQMFGNAGTGAFILGNDINT